MADMKNKREYAKKEYSNGKENKNEKNIGKKNENKQESRGSVNVKKPFAYHLVPYILSVFALFCVICFVANAICNPNNILLGGRESEHTLGAVGFYFCYGLLGTLGYAAYALPVIFFVLVAFWKNYTRRMFFVVNSIAVFASVSIISALCHIFMHMSDGVENFSYNIAKLFSEGASVGGGGVVGGLLSFAMVNILNIFGAIFVLVAIIIPLLLFLFGTTPVEAGAFIGKRIKKSYLAAAERSKQRKIEKANEKKILAEKKKIALIEAKAAMEDMLEEEREEKRRALEEEKIRREKEKAALTDSKDSENDGEALILPKEIEKDECKININIEDNEGESISLNAFSDRKITHSDDIKTPAELDAEEINGEDSGNGVEELDTSVLDKEEKTVVFVNDKIKKKSIDSVDEMVSDLFNDDDETQDTVSDDTAREEIFDIDLDDDDDELDNEPTPIIIPEYKFPPVDLLEQGNGKYASDAAEIELTAQKLRNVLQEFKINVKEINCSCGPTITRYEIKLDAGIRVKQIVNLADDIAYALAAKGGIRIEAPIPGKTAVGVEVPNDKKSAVKLRSLIENPEFTEHESKIACCLGADVAGAPVIFDIEKMPHLLVAGTTGSGKSVCINSIIMSILYRAKPSEVKLLLIDPKKVEFKVYKNIPHLCCRIVNDAKKAAGALNSAVNEMEKRFELIEEVGVRNITGYNEITKNDPEKPYMPRMIIIIDEFADLMMTAKDEVETAVCRIAQKARAAGIHLIIGTQRPSVDVITGLIKANIPSRIAFTVMSQVDSRTIIDVAGAEKLCGRGDMLFSPVGITKPLRVQGAFVSDGEVERVVDFVKENNAPVVYDSEFEMSIDVEAAKCGNNGKNSGYESNFSGGSGDEDSKLYDAVDLAIDAGKISTSLLQRRLEVGYGRAAKIIDRMEELGYVGPADGNKPRKILITREEFNEKMMNQ